jgi:hypothetical protein
LAARATFCQKSTSQKSTSQTTASQTTTSQTTKPASQTKEMAARKRPQHVLDYLEDDGPYPGFVYDALGETFSQKDLGRLLLSMAK